MQLSLLIVVWIGVPCIGHSFLRFKPRKGKHRHAPKELHQTNGSNDFLGQKQQDEARALREDILKAKAENNVTALTEKLVQAKRFLVDNSKVASNNLSLTRLSPERQKHRHQNDMKLDEASDSNSSVNADVWNGGLRHRPLRVGYGPGPLLLLYTTSGTDKHAESLCLSAEFMKRKGMSDPLKYADVIVDVNNATWEQQRKMEDCLKLFPNTYTRLTKNNINAGYRMGAVQAVDSEVKWGITRDYEWIIHLHPDNFIVDDSKLLLALENSSASVIASSWSCPAFETELLAFSFFAFRPDKIAIDAFQYWEKFEEFPETYLRYVAFRTQMENGEVMLVPGTGMVPPCTREIDGFGLWHSHDTTEVMSYLVPH